MRCSVCQGHTLKPIELEKGLIAASCSNCYGSLLSLISYRFWVDNHAEKMTSAINDEDILVEDSSSVRNCPKCSRLMSKYQICASSENRVDLCAGCDEVWLDQGEWELLKRLDISEKLTSFFTDAWQRQIRLDREAETLKARYEKLIGEDDFARVSEFKYWLDQHPEKAGIKHYLNMSS